LSSAKRQKNDDNKFIMAINEAASRIKRLREVFNNSRTDFAKNLGIKRTSLINYESGGTIPSSFLDKLKSTYSVNIDWLMYGEGEPFEDSSEKLDEDGKNLLSVYKKSKLPKGGFVIPLLDQQLSAGNGSLLPEEDEFTALVQVPAYLSSYGKNIAALTVDGDSMYPTLNRGDMIVCDSCGWSGDGIYALRMGGSGIVKRLTKSSGKIIIISDNPKYPQREEPEESEDIQIIGRVHCAIKKME
jgi:phage repressor protein C with HTH and peptisase S24 domain